MRTKEEKEFQIKGLEEQKKNLPEFSHFGDNNWEKIDAQISMLKGFTFYENYEDDDDLESSAYDCKMWLDCEINENLFD